MRGYRGGIIFVFLCRHFQQEAVNANLGYRYKQSFVGFVEVDGLVGWFSFSCKPLLWVLLLFCRVCGLEQPGFTEPSREEEARLHPWADRNWGKICGRFADSAGGNFTQICWIIHTKYKYKQKVAFSKITPRKVTRCSSYGVVCVWVGTWCVL